MILAAAAAAVLFPTSSSRGSLKNISLDQGKEREIERERENLPLCARPSPPTDRSIFPLADERHEPCKNLPLSRALDLCVYFFRLNFLRFFFFFKSKEDFFTDD